MILFGVKKNEKWGIINQRGEEIVPCVYDFIGCFKEGFAIVRKGRECGYIDEMGKEVISCVYYHADDFDKNLAKVENINGRKSLIDKTGKEIASCNHDENIEKFNEELILFIDNYGGLWLIDKTGEVINSCCYKKIEKFEDGLYSVVDATEKCGLMDEFGKEVIPCIYEYIGFNFSEGLIWACKNNKWGFIDKNNKEIIPFIYECAGNFGEGLAGVMMGRKWGFIDKTGKEVIPFIYDQLWNKFIGGYVAVKREKWWRFIDKTGKEVHICNGYWDAERALQDSASEHGFILNEEKIPNKISNKTTKVFSYFDDPYIEIRDNLHKKVNTLYNYVSEAVKCDTLLHFYDEARYYTEYIKVRKDGKWGLLDKDENEILKPVFYDEIEFVKNLSDDYIKINLDGRETIVDRNGKIIS